MTNHPAPTTSLGDLKEAYDRDGYVFPIRAISPDQIGAIRLRLEDYLARSNRNAKEDVFLQFKVHLILTWADQIVRHPAILDAVEALIGPDILVWNTAVLIKKPHDRDFVSWHQDIYYWGNDPDHVVGAWVAIVDSTAENGCVRVIPGSHKWGVLPHVDTFGQDNMLSRGQQVVQPIDDDLAVDMVLRAGEMSLHHTATVHGSRPNRSNRWRMGFVITYMAPATIMIGPRTGATLVRGTDTHGHFDLEDTRPASDLEPASLLAHAEAMRPFSAAIYEGAGKDGRLSVDRISGQPESKPGSRR